MIRTPVSSQFLEIKLRVTVKDAGCKQFKYEVKHFGTTTNEIALTIRYYPRFVEDNQFNSRPLIVRNALEKQ
jgi:Fe-S cluster assembly iron-binding protein IscA